MSANRNSVDGLYVSDVACGSPLRSHTYSADSFGYEIVTTACTEITEGVTPSEYYVQISVSSVHSVVIHSYDAFGNPLATSNSELATLLSFRFSTKYLDPETGFYYYGYRYYNPDLGRWLTRDPIEEQGGLNLYGFCENDGVNKSDLIGLKVLISVNKNLSASVVPQTACGSGRGNNEIRIKLYFSCKSCVFLASGKYTKIMNVLTSSHVKWNARLSQYNAKWGVPRSNSREREATIAHEEDHWRSWLPFEKFLEEMNSLDGKVLGNCKKYRDIFDKKSDDLIKLFKIKSNLFDTPPWNQGGMNEN